MTSIAEAAKPGGLDGEPIALADCNPELLQQLARQERVNQEPIVMRGCEVSIYRRTITVKEGIVFLPGRWLTPSPTACFELAPPHTHKPRIDSIVVHAFNDADDSTGKTGPEAQVITGTPATSPLPPNLSPGAIMLGSVLVAENGMATLYFDEGSVRNEVTKRDRERRERQDACRHVGAHRVETTTWSAMARTYRVTCPHCDYSWTEQAGAGCCDDTICYCGQGES